MTDATERLVRAQIDHNCFGCGSLNRHGLRMTFHVNDAGGGVVSRWIPEQRFEGYGGMVHGGIICTLLDEVMAWSLYTRETWAVTAKMETRFRHPVEIGVPVLVRGSIVRERGRLFEVSGEIRREGDGTLLAESSATFMRVPDAQSAEWRDRYGIESALGEDG